MISKGFELDADLRFIGNNLERASSDRMRVEIIVTLFGDVFRRNDHRAITGELGDQDRIRGFKVEIDSLVVDNFNLVDCDIVGTLRTFRAIFAKQTIKGEFYGFRIERLAVMELDAFA